MSSDPTRTGSLAMPELARGRLVLLAGGGVGLLAGLVTGLARAGVISGADFGGGNLALHHGVLFTLGFFGTLIALERAVAAGRSWVYAAPAASGLAVLWLVAGGSPRVSGVLLTAAGLLVTAVYVELWRSCREHYLAVMGLGGVAWAASGALWTGGASPVRLVPFLAAFLVLTIIGERLELSRLRMPSRAATRRMLGITSVFSFGVGLSWFAYGTGLAVAGVALVALTAWFARNDIARVTIRKEGLPRFAAACMLSGYVWLAVGGTLWVALGLRVGGPLVYDAAVHAVFLGFVLSMVMGHAPIILPAVLRVDLPYRPVAWLPLALLHLTLLGRVSADLLGSTWGRGASAAANVAAVCLFVLLSVATAAHARRRPASPVRTPVAVRP